jgi:hypothetical protein
VLNKQPQRIEKLIHECDQGAFDDGRRQIENKINELYDSLAASLKDENKRLTAIIKKLTDENSLLRLQVKNLQS